MQGRNGPKDNRSGSNRINPPQSQPIGTGYSARPTPSRPAYPPPSRHSSLFNDPLQYTYSDDHGVKRINHPILHSEE